MTSHVPSFHASALFSQSVCIPDWHARFGHPFPVVVHKAVSTHNLSCSKASLDFACTMRPQPKAHKLPFVNNTHQGCKNIFDIVYTDIWTAPVHSVTGVKYFLLLVDDFSRFMWIYFLSSKSQAKNAMNLFKTMVERPFNTSIKAVQSDGGGEFMFLASHWQAHGIIHRVTCPHTSEQNGVVESRLRRVVLCK